MKMKKTILFVVVMFLFVNVALATAPVMSTINNVTIEPIPAETNTSLLSYCNVTDADTYDMIQYESIWYNNSVRYESYDIPYPDIRNYSFTYELTLGTAVHGIYFKPDGTRMYIADYGLNKILEFECTTPWKLQTCNIQIRQLDVSSFGSDTSAVEWKLDGTKMYITGWSADRISAFDCSTSWNVSSCVYNNENLSVQTEQTSTNTVRFKPDGTRMFVGGHNPDYIYQYDCTTAWNVSSCGLVGNFSNAPSENPRGFDFSSNGVQLYIADTILKSVFQFNCTEAYNVSTCVYTNNSIVTNTGGSVGAAGFTIRQDNKHFYIADPQDNSVRQFTSTFPTVSSYAGINTNVNNLSSSIPNLGDDWIFSCRGYDGTSYTSWLNSSTLTIIDIPPVIDSINDINITIYPSWTYQTNCTDTETYTDTLYYWINDSIGTISSTGLISSEPNETQIGTHNVLITCGDLTTNITTTFTLITYNASFTNCSAGDPLLIYNITIYDEDNPTTYLDSTLQIQFTTWNDARTQSTSYSEILNGTYTYYICAANNFTYDKLDVYIKNIETSGSGFTHRFFIINDTVIPGTLTDHFLYNFPSSTGISDLKITVRDKTTYNYMENVIGKLQRLYVGESTWRTVQMDQSGDYGLIFFNIYEEDTDYRIIFVDEDDNILQTTQSMKFVCDSGICDITYTLDPYSTTSDVGSLVFDWDYDNTTGIITVSWNDAGGLNYDIRSIITKETMSGTLVVCDNTTTGTSSGEHICDVSGHTGTFLVRARSSRSPWLDRLHEWISVHPLGLWTVVDAKEGAFWTFGIMVTITLAGAVSPIGAVISMLFSLVALLFLGMFNAITIPFVTIACVLGIVIGIKLKR